MSLEYAILGFLSYAPLSGYDLKKFFDNSVCHFWTADQCQIYRTLARLGEAGSVEMRVVEQSARPDRKVYSITEKGRKDLEEWLAQPFQGGDARNPVLLKTFFSGKCTDQEVLTAFEDAEQQLRAMMAVYETTPQMIDHFKAQVGSEREAFFWNLTLEWGVRITQANLAWVQSIIARIQTNQVPQQ